MNLNPIYVGLIVVILGLILAGKIEFLVVALSVGLVLTILFLVFFGDDQTPRFP